MATGTSRQHDVMLMILGLDVAVIGAVLDLYALVFAGCLFPFLVYTNELRRRHRQGKISTHRD